MKLYKTRFMLDELGNLQSEGHGIQGLQTDLSIGLGQDQQFTLILQTLQQLKDIYGESVDKIIQGNAQPLTSHVATPTGWKLMRDIQVGDEVLTPNGTVTTVTGVYPKGVRPVYDVELRDGSHAEACNEHLWYITMADDDCHSVSEDLVTTDVLKSYLEAKKRIYLPDVKPLVYTKKDLVIDSYMLGFILSSKYDFSSGVFDFSDVKGGKKSELYNIGYDIHKPVDLQAELSILGLHGLSDNDKFIPEHYLFASVKQRIRLLNGLCDSFGYVESTLLRFDIASDALAKNIQMLIRSLGGVCDISKDTSLFKLSATMNFSPFCHDIWSNWDMESNHAYFNTPIKAVRSVTYLRDDEVQCISVADESHLYITDDYIPTHNTSNIVFLKSTDDSMLDTLQKMSGTTHRSYTDSKTITRDKQRIFMQNESKISYTMTTKEVPVISYNDMAFISEKNSIVFRAGDPPVWNRNETILPMSWRLFQNTIVHAGHKYSLQTIPTLSSALDFDVRKNQPDFVEMLNKRMEQALIANKAKEAYKNAYGYTDYQISQLDPDVYADEIMSIINTYLRKQKEVNAEGEGSLDYDNSNVSWLMQNIEDNPEVDAARLEAEKRQAENDRNKFAQGKLSPSAFMSVGGQVNHGMDTMIVAVYVDTIGGFKRDTVNFMVKGNNSLYSKDGQTLYIESVSNSEDLKKLNQAAQDENSKVYSEGKIEQHQSYVVTDAFLKFLATRDQWDFAEGQFEKGMGNKMKQ